MAVWTRHIADSAQLAALAPHANRWVDMGSGAGFPGVVIAIQLADVPGAIVHCIESDGGSAPSSARRRVQPAQRLRSTMRGSKESSPEASDLWTPSPHGPSHPLPLALKLARPWMANGAIAVFPRGESAKDQIAALPEATAYAIETLPSIVDPKAAILRIRQG